MTLVILSEAKNLTFISQMLRLRLSMTTHQSICDRTNRLKKGFYKRDIYSDNFEGMKFGR